MPDSPDRWSFEKHREEQLLFVARHSTPFERLQWLEESLDLLGPHLKDRLLREKADRASKW